MLSGLRVAAGGELAQDVTLTVVDGGASFEFGGIGANLQLSADGVAFGDVFPGNPAARGGMHAGDRIVGIDGQSTTGLSLTDVLQLLRGPAGTTVGISVRSTEHRRGHRRRPRARDHRSLDRARLPRLLVSMSRLRRARSSEAVVRRRSKHAWA